jgi:thioredoxin reductase
MPSSFRVKVVKRHLGPAPCWFVRNAVDGRIPMHLSTTVAGADPVNGKARLLLRRLGREDTRLEVDHVIAATGYKAAVSRLSFMDHSLQARVRTVDGAPILDRQFESSVPGLYFVGAAAANSFGPLLRFAFGARFAARRVASHLAGN